jgi:hypothetical protein
MHEMNYLEKLISLVSRKKPQPPIQPREETKLNYTADVIHLNVASIECGEIDDSEFNAALASYEHKRQN